MIDEELWRELEAGRGAALRGRVVKRLHPDSMNDIYVGVSFPANERMLVIPASRAAVLRAVSSLKTVHDARGIAVRIHPLDGASSELQVVLTSPGLAAVFTPLVQDIAETAADADGIDVVRSAVDRYARWQELMQAVGTGGLSLESRRGLFGELHVLRKHILAVLPSSRDGVRAWTGPDKADQDFQLARCAIEVKTTKRRSPAVVRISSERQLDAVGVEQLFLTAIVVDERQGGVGESLPATVEAIRDALGPGTVRGEFEVALAKCGYFDFQSELYAEPRYTVVSDDAWLIGDGFPRLTVADVPAGVSKCSYDLNLDELSPFRCTSTELHEAVAEASE